MLTYARYGIRRRNYQIRLITLQRTLNYAFHSTSSIQSTMSSTSQTNSLAPQYCGVPCGPPTTIGMYYTNGDYFIGPKQKQIMCVEDDAVPR